MERIDLFSLGGDCTPWKKRWAGGAHKVSYCFCNWRYDSINTPIYIGYTLREEIWVDAFLWVSRVWDWIGLVVRNIFSVYAHDMTQRWQFVIGLIRCMVAYVFLFLICEVDLCTHIYFVLNIILWYNSSQHPYPLHKISSNFQSKNTSSPNTSCVHHIFNGRTSCRRYGYGYHLQSW